MEILVATTSGLHTVDPARDAPPDLALEGRDVTALAHDGKTLWALLDGRTLARRTDGGWEEVAASEKWPATCLLAGGGERSGGGAPSGNGRRLAGGALLAGTAEAHLLRLTELPSGTLEPLASFEDAPGREEWYTPWGGPPDTRSLAADGARRIYVNVHVGGILRSDDGGETWRQTIDPDSDVHEVLAPAGHSGLVLAAAAVGCAVSRDGGDTWTITHEGASGSYMRAVALCGSWILVSASTGHRGGDAGLYRAPLDDPSRFRACTSGLPESFEDNIDTGWLNASGTVAAFGSPHGSVFLSRDAGETWAEVARGLPGIRAVRLA